MSLSKLASGRWGAQVYDPASGRNVRVSKILGADYISSAGVAGSQSFRTKSGAKAAREDARARLTAPRGGLTIAEWATRWTTDPLFARPKRSTDLHNAERIKEFVARYGDVPLVAMATERGDGVVAEWLAGGRRNSTIGALRVLFNDSMSAKAGRLLARSPFAGLGIAKTKGNKDKTPPNIEQMETLLRHARDLTPPSFAAYLEFGCVSGIRPGEIDALPWENIRWDAHEIDILVQWSVKLRQFDTPKYGPYTVALTARARAVLLNMKREQADSPFVFTTIRGTHYTPSSRTHHWNRVRAAAGLGNTTLYMATRHHFGWYALNVLGLESAVIAEQFGHKDGGKLVEQLYGHPDRARRRQRLREAHDGVSDRKSRLRVVREGRV
jgi:integrase